MEILPPGSRFDFVSDGPDDKSDPPGNGPSEIRVIVWDPRASRAHLVGQLVSRCGAKPLRVASISALQQGETSFRCTIAVVALGSGAAKDNLALRVIRFLKHHGIKTVCYEDEARSWPLGVRFQSLLAGASWLLDSSQEGFARELEHLLTGLLQAEVSGRAAEDGLKSAMNRLGIVGDSHAMIAIFRSVLRVSQLSDLPIMIEGETGTGKELIARAIYQLDAKRCLGPFVAVNCGAISPSLAESELFGHRRGAFTGAEWGRKGLIRSAQGGVLFLDEIGEMDVGLQTKLLRVLQEGRVLGVGEDEDVPVNFRVIAATNRDLNRLVEQSKFRADLLHRLNVLTIRIPPLRERPGDLKSLVAHFLDKYQQLRPAASFAIGQEFIDALVHSPLFGNARQLENLVRWAIVNKDDDSALGLGDLPPEIWQWLSQQSAPSTASQPDSGQAEQSATSQELFPQIPSPLVDVFQRNEWCLSRSLDQCERWLLEAALERAQGNQSQMARMLGITPRSVYNKLRKHRLRG